MIAERIVCDPNICGGEPVVRGTRVLVRAVLGHLAHGVTVEAILGEFPTLTEDDVRAVVAFTGSPERPQPSVDRRRLVAELQRSSPPQTTDSTDLLLDDRERT